MAHIAELSVNLTAAGACLDRLCGQLDEIEMEVTRNEAGAKIHAPGQKGVATITVGARGLHVRAESEDEQDVRIFKFILGLFIEKAAADEAPEVVWTGYGADFEVLPNFNEITVTSARNVTPHMRRITFTGAGLSRLYGNQIHVRLLFPPTGLKTPEWPKPGKNGRPAWPPEGRCPAARVYTIRAFDAAREEIDIDFVLHGDEGVAGRWAAAARPGDLIGLLGPGGEAIRSGDWRLIAGDETAIPAIARQLQLADAACRGHVFIEVEGPQEEQPLPTPAGMEIVWLHRNGAARHGELLREAVSVVRPPDQHSSAWFWLGAEAETVRRLRSLWLDELKIPRRQVLAVPYWREGETREEAV